MPHLLPWLRRLVGSLLIAGLASSVLADLRPASLFQSGVVLQRDRPVPVWGKDDPGTTVTVEFAGQKHTTLAGTDGRWQVQLDPLPAEGQGRRLVLTGSTTVTLDDVLVGEVWLASGQSNMEWTVAQSFDADLEAVTARFPTIREFRIRHTPASQPADAVQAQWVAAGPGTVARLSAVPYFFARELHLALEVPVGIIHSVWGGTMIEAWMSPAAIDATPHAAAVRERWATAVREFPGRQEEYTAALAKWKAAREAAAAAGQVFTEREPRAPRGAGSQDEPSSLYHGMIVPLVPAAIRGFIWYQGESNGGRPGEYGGLFTSLIEHWRRDFGSNELPFYWVQLAAYNAGRPSGRNWAELRAAQASALRLPQTGQAIAVDLTVSEIADVHPRAKLAIGRRLARLALNRTYGYANLAVGGPEFNAAAFVPKAEVRQPNQPAELLVTFLPSDRNLRQPLENVTGFEVAGEDKVFYPARARIELGRRVFVHAPEVPNPVAVRYAWINAAAAGLVDDLGLPVPPFRSDTW